MEPERADRLLAFLQTADRLKSVHRATYLTAEERREDDAQHTFHMALFALLLAPETGPHLDMARVFELILVHDLPEILAGDTPAYDFPARLAAEAREDEAATELFALLPDDLRDRLHHARAEFEHGDSPEARFARAIDRLQGFAQQVFSGGRGWREHGVTPERTHSRMQAVRDTHPALGALLDVLYARADQSAMWTQPPTTDL
jgi:putative hydrolase of HD superfamily